MELEKVLDLLLQSTGGWTAKRQALLASCPDNAYLVECSDERSGKRFGTAKIREGCCMKIGSGGRNPTSLHKPYQIWAVWDKQESEDPADRTEGDTNGSSKTPRNLRGAPRPIP